MISRRSLFAILPGASMLFGGSLRQNQQKISVSSVNCFPSIVPVWTGDSVDSIGQNMIIVPGSMPEDSECLRFYGGQQWDEKIQHDRRAKGRPCIVINKLPALVDAFIRRSSRTFDHRELVTVICAVTRRNMDAQRLYNYMVSSSAELALTRNVVVGIKS